MCKKTKGCGRIIDPCMKNIIHTLKDYGFDIRACCCGHHKYDMTIVCYSEILNEYFDFMTLKTIYRKNKFYKKDKNGFYYIPECVKGGNKK